MSSRQLKYIRNQHKRGYKQVHLWVPKEDVERIRKFAAKLRTNKAELM